MGSFSWSDSGTLAPEWFAQSTHHLFAISSRTIWRGGPEERGTAPLAFLAGETPGFIQTTADVFATFRVRHACRCVEFTPQGPQGLHNKAQGKPGHVKICDCVALGILLVFCRL